MKSTTKTRLILAGLVAVHVVLYFCVWRTPLYFPVTYLGVAVSPVLPAQGVLLGFWVAMGRRWTIPWRVAFLAAVFAILMDAGYGRLVGRWPLEDQGRLLVWELCSITVALLAARALGLRLGHTAAPTESHNLLQFSLLEILSWITATAISLRILKSLPGGSINIPIAPVVVPWTLPLVVVWILHVLMTLIPLACIWVVFGRRWLVMRILAVVVVVVASSSANCAGMRMSRTVNPAISPIFIYYSAYTAWLIASFLVIRWAGYRLEWPWRLGRSRPNQPAAVGN